MSGLGRFVDGFGKRKPTASAVERPDEDPIWAELDALHDERVERLQRGEKDGPHWFPPQGLEPTAS